MADTTDDSEEEGCPLRQAQQLESQDVASILWSHTPCTHTHTSTPEPPPVHQFKSQDMASSGDTHTYTHTHAHAHALTHTHTLTLTLTLTFTPNAHTPSPLPPARPHAGHLAARLAGGALAGGGARAGQGGRQRPGPGHAHPVPCALRPARRVDVVVGRVPVDCCVGHVFACGSTA
eukprot:225976-Chlamydomonas_euryale.AAC.1